MSAEDYMPDDWDRDDGPDVGYVVCRFCKKGGFHWQEEWETLALYPRWFLVNDDGELHNCRVADVSEFEDLTDADADTTSSTTVAGRPVNRPGNATEPRKQATRRKAPARRRERASQTQRKAI